jgi:tetratricopeptide (TPR) repeat protein
MRLQAALLALAVLWAVPAAAADPLAEARRLYNQGQYDTAARYAREAMKTPATMDSARLVLGRIHLERYRRSAEAVDLTQAREALANINPALLDARERTELLVGMGECLFLEDKFGTAAEVFERALDGSESLGTGAHGRVLDWWATSLDRLALSRPRESRDTLYARIVTRMEKELALDPGSAPAAYWLAAALRSAGSLERAWHAAMAGWILATLNRDHGAELRADLDRLMTLGIIPERAAKLQPRDPKQATGSMLAEWESVKGAWTR